MERYLSDLFIRSHSSFNRTNPSCIPFNRKRFIFFPQAAVFRYDSMPLKFVEIAAANIFALARVILELELDRLGSHRHTSIHT